MVKTYLSTLWIFEAPTKNPRLPKQKQRQESFSTQVMSTCRTSFPRGVGIMDVPFSSSPSLVSSISGTQTTRSKRVRESHAHDKYSWWMMITWWWSLRKKTLMMLKMMIMMTIGCSCRMSNISSIDPPTCNLKWTLLGPLRPSLRQLSKMPHWALCTGWFLLIGGGTIIRYIDEKTFF